MKLVDRYLFSSIIKSSMLVLLGLVIIFSFFKFLEEISDIGSQNYIFSTALQHILLLVPSFFNSLFILAIMIGTVLVIGEFNNNKELQILYTGGISAKSIMLKCIKYPFLISIFLLIFFEIFSPQSLRLANILKSEALGKQINNKVEELWLKKDDSYILFNNKEKSIKLFDTINNIQLNKFYSGDGAEFHNQILAIKHFQVMHIDNSLNPPKIESYLEDKEINFELSESEINALNNNPKAMTISALIKLIFFSIENEINLKDYYIELFARLAKPLTLIGMVLISLPFIFNNHRSTSIGNRLFISISIGVLTHLMSRAMLIVSLKFEFLSLFAVFLPGVILALFGLILIKIKKIEF